MRVQLQFPAGMSQRDQGIIYRELRQHFTAHPAATELEANRRAQAFVKERYAIDTTLRIQRPGPQQPTQPTQPKINIDFDFQGSIGDEEKQLLSQELQAHFALHPPTSKLEAHLRMQAFMDGYNARQKFES